MLHILVFNHDLKKYPPILTIINILLETEEKVIYLGDCSDKELLESLIARGLVYQRTIQSDVSDPKLKKLIKIKKYKSEVGKFLKQLDKTSTLWLFGNENVWLFDKAIPEFKTILYLFEMPILRVGWKYLLLNPSVDYHKAMNSAWKVVCCEYNRAHITHAFFNLKEMPVIIPNKPKYEHVFNDTCVAEDVAIIFKTKKVILYQGIFNYPERRLDELCESLAFLDENFVVCIMGSEDSNKDRLRQRYKSNRIIFLPFLSAPKHLAVTKLAFIGFLSYFSSAGNIEHALNTLYCAPNKIFEYSNFGIPMISNDVPALKFQFDKFNSGIAVSDFTPEKIAHAVIAITENYQTYSEGAASLFSSIDIDELVKTNLLIRE